MKLTKEEIKFIDNYLIKNKVKFWDVRLELLDHIISAVEDKIKNEGISFNEALLDVHRGFGNQLIESTIPKNQLFNKGLYQSNIGFEKFVRRKQKEIGRKQRNIYCRMFLPFLISKQFIVEFIAIISAILFVFQYDKKSAFIVAMVIALLPEFTKIFTGVFHKANRKSLRVQLAFSLSALFMSLNYIFLEGLKYLFGKNTSDMFFYGICFYLFLFVFLRHSFNIYRKITNQNRNEYFALIS